MTRTLHYEQSIPGGAVNHSRLRSAILPVILSLFFAPRLGAVDRLDDQKNGTGISETGIGDLFDAELHQDTTFVEVSTSLPGIYSGNAVWFDYDNDGDLDILMSGLLSDETTYVSKVFRNDVGSFVDLFAPLVGVGSEDGVAWGDYDNDGDWDIAIAGRTDEASTDPVSNIYRNENGSFVNVNAGLLGLNGGSVSWADYDNDGDLDLFICGSPDRGLTFYSKIYRNTNGTFTDANVGFPGVWGSSVGWADFDNDGDLDIIITGYGDLGVTAILFSNHAGTFTNSGESFEVVNSGGIASSDYDNDGDLDLAICGAVSGGASSRIYQNNNGTFTDIGAPLQPLAVSALAWGDYTNDGAIDLIITGTDDFFGANPKTRLYRNNGSSFVDVNTPIAGTWFGSTAWGDYDNDGDLDLLLTGGTSSSSPHNPITKLFRNNAIIKNLPPSPPTIIQSTQQSNSVSLHWNRASDSLTAVGGLSYNLRIGTTMQGSDVLNANSIISSGFRRTPRMGNAHADTTWTIRNLPPGKYYWSVQSIDNGFLGSPFAEVDSFVVIPTAVRPEQSHPERHLLIHNYPNPFNPITTISYYLHKREFVTLTIHNVLGEEIASLVEQWEEPGKKEIRFDASYLSSGVYWYRLVTRDVVDVKAMHLLR